MTQQNSQQLLLQGYEHHQKNELSNAKECYKKTLALDKNNADANHLMGLILKAEGKVAKGIDFIKRAIKQSPNAAVYHFNLGRAYHELFDLEKSVASLYEAIRLQEDYADAYYNLGIVYEDHNHFTEAAEAYRHALKLSPNNINMQFNLAMTLLRSFQFVQGWEAYKMRYVENGANTILELPYLSKPRYENKSVSLRGKRLLVHAEQGFGDTFQFLRFLPQLKDRFGLKELYFVPQKELFELFYPMEGWLNAKISEAMPDSIHYDYVLPLLDLGWLYGADVGTIPFREKYFYAEAALSQSYQNRFFNHDAWKIGLVWQGRPTHKNDKNRSVNFDLLAPLLKFPNTIFYSLQKENYEGANKFFEKHDNFINLSSELKGFEDTAAILANLDLIITVDTSVAHLAAAMGKECWMLLPYSPDWRWGALDPSIKENQHEKYRHTSYWYDSVLLYRQGAERHYKSVIKELLADLRTKVGEGEARPLPRIKKRRISPNSLNESTKLTQLAFAHHQKGEMKKAKELYKTALSHNPDNADALHLLGLVYKSDGQLNEGIDFIRQAIAVNPDNQIFYKNLGNALSVQKEHAEASEAYEKALAFDPQNVELLFLIAKAAQEVPQRERARCYYKMILTLDPNHLFTLANLAILEKTEENFEEAIGYYRRILQVNPTYPDNYYNMAMAYKALKRTEDEVACYKKALEINPTHGDSYLGLSKQYESTGNFEEAIRAMRSVIELNPDQKTYQGQLLRFQSLGCDWEGLNELKDRVFDMSHGEDAKIGINTQYAVMFLGEFMSEAQLLEIARIFANNRLEAARYNCPDIHYSFDRPRNKKIRIGYVSGDFYNHATLHLLIGVLEQHNKEKFEIVAYSLHHKTGSIYYDRLLESIDEFVDLSSTSLTDICDRIYSDKIDILIDLKGYTHDARPEIFFLKPAPIQVSWLGMPGTMGTSIIDYMIADKTVIPPENEQFYSEKIVYMPHCYQPNDDTQVISSDVITRADCDLPEDAFVFCDFNNPYKVDSTVFDIWMEILREAPNAVLWQLSDKEPITENLKNEAAKRGIDPNRLIFAKAAIKERHLKRMQLADLFLDTINCNAHTTASDSIYAGLPLLSLAGNTFAKRVAASILVNVGLEEMIVSSVEEYKAKALEFYHSKEKLSEVREKLAQNLKTYPLYDTKKFAMNLEAGFETIYENYYAGNEARTIVLPD